jgi:hypothetical protein
MRISYMELGGVGLGMGGGVKIFTGVGGKERVMERDWRVKLRDAWGLLPGRGGGMLRRGVPILGLEQFVVEEGWKGRDNYEDTNNLVEEGNWEGVNIIRRMGKGKERYIWATALEFRRKVLRVEKMSDGFWSLCSV